MPIIVFIVITIIVGYLILVFLSSYKSAAEGIIKAESDGSIETKIIYDENKKKALYAMALLYFAKIKWLSLTDSMADVLGELYKDGLNEILNNWPYIPDLNMVPVDKNKPLIFKIKIYQTVDYWSMFNTIPRKVYAVDVIASCFILLQEIIKHLNDHEKEELKNLLLKIKNDLLTLNNPSITAFNNLNKKISNLVNSYQSNQRILPLKSEYLSNDLEEVKKISNNQALPNYDVDKNDLNTQGSTDEITTSNDLKELLYYFAGGILIMGFLMFVLFIFVNKYTSEYPNQIVTYNPEVYNSGEQ